MKINNRPTPRRRILSLSCFLFLWLLWSLAPALATLISLDDGRLIRFSGPPAVDTLVPVGTFQAGSRYTVRFDYDLVSNCFSASLNGARVVNREPIPSHFNFAAIDKFGFDVNQKIALEGLPPPRAICITLTIFASKSRKRSTCRWYSRVIESGRLPE